MDRFDVLMFLGLALISTGCGLISIPLGLIAGGAGCVAIALIGARGQAGTVDARQKRSGMTAPQKDNG